MPAVFRGDVCRFDSMFGDWPREEREEPQKKARGVLPWLTSRRADEVAAGVAQPMRHPPGAGNGPVPGHFKLVTAVAAAVWLVQSGGVRADLRPAARAVRDNSGDPGGWRAPSRELRGTAADIRASIARSENPARKCAAESATWAK